MEWILDGIGTQLIVILISLITGTVGFKYIKYQFKQKQISGNNATQTQIVNAKRKVKNNQKSNSKQIQKAGDNASQVQIGGLNINE